jgi:hypothetical protein
LAAKADSSIRPPKSQLPVKTENSVDAPENQPRKGHAMKTKFGLFKRADSGSDSWNFRFTFRGKSYVRCLETRDATEAKRRRERLPWVNFEQTYQTATRLRSFRFPAPCALGHNRVAVDEVRAPITQGSPEGFRGNPGL